jgi:L-fucose mutarotase/ribose pyranase (RbsD/FucU family)
MKGVIVMDMLTKGTILFASISFLPVTLYFFKVLFFKKLKEQRQQEIALLKEQSYMENLMQKQKIKEIYEQERKPYYEEARSLFNVLMKNAKLTHDQIMHIKKLLENALGEKVHDFDDFTHEVKKKNKDGTIETFRKKGFQNEAHRIYCYMKSYNIDVSDWKKIIGFLNECAKIANVG